MANMASTKDVAAWLASIGLEQYAPAIVVENGCDTMDSVVHDLDDAALTAMGVKPFHRKRILRKIAEMKKAPNAGIAAAQALPAPPARGSPTMDAGATNAKVDDGVCGRGRAAAGEQDRGGRLRRHPEQRGRGARVHGRL